MIRPEAHCKSIDQNQVSVFNKITLYGGHMDTEILLDPKNSENAHEIKKALIYDEAQRNWADIGILFTKKHLFDHKKLLKLPREEEASILPICLPSNDLDLADKTITV